MGLPIFREPEAEQEKPTSNFEPRVHDRTSIRRTPALPTRRSRILRIGPRPVSSTLSRNSNHNDGQETHETHSEEARDDRIRRQMDTVREAAPRPNEADVERTAYWERRVWPGPTTTAQSRPHSRRGPTDQAAVVATENDASALELPFLLPDIVPSLPLSATELNQLAMQIRNSDGTAQAASVDPSRSLGMQVGANPPAHEPIPQLRSRHIEEFYQRRRAGRSEARPRVDGLGDRERSWSPESDDLETLLDRQRERIRARLQRRRQGVDGLAGNQHQNPNQATGLSVLAETQTRDDRYAPAVEATEGNHASIPDDTESLFCDDPDPIPTSNVRVDISRLPNGPVSPMALLQHASELYHHYLAAIEENGGSNMSAVAEQRLARDLRTLLRRLRRAEQQARINVQLGQGEAEDSQSTEQETLGMGRL